MPTPPVRPAMLSVEEARAYLLERARPIEENERIAVDEALGRIVATDVTAPIDVPGRRHSGPWRDDAEGDPANRGR